MEINEMKIGELLKLAELFSGKKASAAPVDHGTQIVILDRGFVYVGSVCERGDWLYISNAKNLRIWGTTRGLGELVNGPLPSTIVDVTGDIKAPLRAVIGMITVKGW